MNICFGRIARYCFVAGAIASGPLAASAAVLTFDSVPGESVTADANCSNIVVEQGFEIRCSAIHDTPGSIHLDDGGTGFSNKALFSPSDAVVNGMRMRAFDAISVNLSGWTTQFGIELDDEPWYQAIRYDNVSLRGFRNGALVALQNLTTDDFIGAADVFFGSAFRNIDLLKIVNTLPTQADYNANPGAMCFDSPCGHFEINSIELMPRTVAVVPLPASIWLLGLAIGLIGWAAPRSVRI